MPSGGAVTVIGSVNLDTTLRVPHIPLAGETVLSRDHSVAAGGKGANQAAAAAAAGGRVRFIGAVGCDAQGEISVENLRAFGIDLSGLQQTEAAASGSATLLVADDAENVIVVNPGANAHLDPRFVARALETERSDVLLTQLETPLDVLRVCAEQREVAWRILNPAPMTSNPELRTILDGFTLLAPNRTELAQLARLPLPTTAAEVGACVAALGFDGVLVVTLGADGAALFRSPGAELELFPPPEVRPVDTTGAGDVFCGYLAQGLAEHGDLETAVRAAVSASARSTAIPRAQLMPRDTEVIA